MTMDITPELLRQAMGCRRERAELFGRALVILDTPPSPTEVWNG